MKRSEVKFISLILTAMLKELHVRVTVLARSLEESIILKKTGEHLSRRFIKDEISERILYI